MEDGSRELSPSPVAAESIFCTALALPLSERPEYLANACGRDARLRQRVEALLRAHEAPEGFLPEHPGSPPAAGSILPSTPVLPEREKPGDRIGRYKLLQKLGEGGCGVVYMAEQEEPVRRRVALKVIKLGMDTRQVIARFEAERQALALMDHPNIARVLDAGATDRGRPYFVMELVGGIKITDYCEQNRLMTHQRLDLFIQVCRAIQHAHQKGVIHRDIKPSNVLVAIQDGVPVPKVIDFGIAKATQGRLTDQTVFTAFEQFLGTPAYMSPEQAQLGGLDVDTRSDIYSLGVLLYELLTGKTPFDTKELLAAGLDAMRRTIQEKEPPTPSTRLTQALVAADVRRLKIEPNSRGPEPAVGSLQSETDRASLRRLLQDVRGDLDWIVMKCLEKDRARRYETANGLAMDLQRHLNQEPVIASPPSRVYRFQKLVRRNRATAVATTIITVVMVLGVAASMWQAWRATRAERRSAREAAKSQQVAGLLKEMLEGAGPSKAQGRDTTMLKEILDRTVERVGKELTNQPEVEIELRAILGGTYAQLGLYQETREMARQIVRIARHNSEDMAQGLMQLAIAENSLGNLEAAETAAREAVVVARKVFGPTDTRTADTLSVLGRALVTRANLADAERVLKESLEVYRQHNDDLGISEILGSLASVLEGQGRFKEAEGMLREALGLRKRVQGAEHPDVAVALHDLGAALFYQGKLPEAEAIYSEAIPIARKTMGNENVRLAVLLESQANTLTKEGRLSESEKLLREALSIYRKVDNQRALSHGLVNLAALLNQQGKLVEAEETIRQGLGLNRTLLGSNHPAVAVCLNILGVVLGKQNRQHEEVQSLREAVAVLRRASNRETGHASSDLGLTLANLADGLLAQNALAEARDHATEAAQLYDLHPDWPPRDRHHAMHVLGEVLVAQGEMEAAEKQSCELLQELRADQTADPELANAIILQASVLQQQGRLEEMEQFYEEEVPLLRAQLGSNAPKLARVLAKWAVDLVSQAKFTAAEPLAKECLAIREKTDPDDWLTFSARALLGASLLGQENFPAAEPLLLSGYEGMKLREARIPLIRKVRLKEALERLVQLYETTGRPEEATEWKKKLAEFDAGRLEKPSAAIAEGKPPL